MKTRIGDISMQIRGVSYKPSDISDGQAPHSIAILRANNISNDGNIETSDLVWIRGERVKPEQFLWDGDILLCASSGSKGLVGKVGFVQIKGVLFGFAVKGDQTLLVLAGLAALVPAVGGKVEHIPAVHGPDIGALAPKARPHKEVI